jgi:hypothetical protein
MAVSIHSTASATASAVRLGDTAHRGHPLGFDVASPYHCSPLVHLLKS